MGLLQARAIVTVVHLFMGHPNQQAAKVSRDELEMPFLLFGSRLTAKAEGMELLRRFHKQESTYPQGVRQKFEVERDRLNLGIN
jgi:hypothetical protein